MANLYAGQKRQNDEAVVLMDEEQKAWKELKMKKEHIKR